MDQKTAFYMKLLLNRFHTGSHDSVLKILPAHGEIVQKTATNEKEISHLFRKPEALLSNIHYSWISEALATLPEEKRPLYIAALPHAQQVQVKKHLNLDREITPLRGPLKSYVSKEFLVLMLEEDHVPLPYQPKTTLDILTTFPKNKMINLIDFLGLYDLAEEIKKIVDTKLLKNINLALSDKQKEFLKSILHQKDKIQFTPFKLNDWTGDSRELELRLHKRGLIRFAKALSGQHPSFVWAITHALDTGRGKMLEGMISKEPVPQVTDFMIVKVQQLIKFLDKE